MLAKNLQTLLNTPENILNIRGLTLLLKERHGYGRASWDMEGKLSMLKTLQRLGKSLMLPVACLPIAGILMGIGYLLAPSAMGATGVYATAPWMVTVGTFLIDAGGALIKNMAILFAIGVAVGMANERDGASALAGLVAWLVITTLLSTTTVAALMGVDAAAVNPAFSHTQTQFIGILAGIIGAACFNRFKNLKLPDYLAFFSGRRAVAIVTALVSLVVSAILFVVWPLLYNALVLIGTSIVSLGAVGAGIYAFLNKILLPFGLHHAINAVFWFDVAGINDLTNFWSGTQTAYGTGMYMTGFFPCMMFGIPAAAYAMYRQAKPERKNLVKGLFVSAALCAFLTGVTEPFEFAFLFAAPGLYVAYAALYGIVTTITVSLPVRAGFSFSAGAIDLFLSSFTPCAENTWMIILIGIPTAIVFFLVFAFAIKRFNLKTPGREDDDQAAAASDAAPALSPEDSAKYAAIASRVLKGLGGKENVASCENCITRLRIEVKDPEKVDEEKLKGDGVIGVMRPSPEAVQVVCGTQVQQVENEMEKLLK